MTHLLRGPLLHFFVIGAVVFALLAAFDDAPPPVEAQTITVTPEDVMRLATEFEATWRRPPSAAELDSLIEGLVRQEVYVREAIALGLDQGDAIIRCRLQQKMEFLTEAGAEAVAPEVAMLEAHLDENSDRFARPDMIAFQKILLKENIDAGRAAEIAVELDQGGDASDLAQPIMLPGKFPASPRHQIDGSFGGGFFNKLLDVPIDKWAGPVNSPFGRHFILVTEREDGFLPPLESIRDQVELDWHTEFAVKLREERFEALRSRYKITRPNAEDFLSE